MIGLFCWLYAIRPILATVLGLVFVTALAAGYRGDESAVREVLAVGLPAAVVIDLFLRWQVRRIYDEIMADFARTIAASSRPEETARRCRESFERHFGPVRRMP